MSGYGPCRIRQQFERMAFRIAKLVRGHSSGRWRQHLRTIGRNRRPAADRPQGCVGGGHVGNDDGEVLEQRTPSGHVGRIWASLWPRLRQRNGFIAKAHECHLGCCANADEVSERHIRIWSGATSEAEGACIERNQRRPHLRISEQSSIIAGLHSWRLHTTAIQEDRIEGRRCANEQPILGEPAKGNVGYSMRHQDFAEQIAVRIDAMHAVRRAAPDVAVFIDPHAIAISGLDLVEDVAARQRNAVGGCTSKTRIYCRGDCWVWSPVSAI